MFARTPRLASLLRRVVPETPSFPSLTYAHVYEALAEPSSLATLASCAVPDTPPIPRHRMPIDGSMWHGVIHSLTHSHTHFPGTFRARHTIVITSDYVNMYIIIHRLYIMFSFISCSFVLSTNPANVPLVRGSFALRGRSPNSWDSGRRCSIRSKDRRFPAFF